jgi:hypothetical protein
VKFTNALAAAAAVAAAGSIGFVVDTPLAAADATTQTLGSQGKLVDGTGNVVQGWTISNLKVSSDTIPHQVNGTLWEATATDEAVQGGATPIVSNLNARARDGETYRVLFGAATPQGVNPATLAQGEKTTGKVYFDVTGEAPDSVVYNAGGQDVLLWVGSPASNQGAPTYSGPARSGSGSSSSTAPSTTPTPGATPATPAADGTVPPATAATEGAPGTPLSSGSQGTPLPAGSAGTPVPAGSTGTPLPATEGAPLPASVGTPASAGTPAPAGTPAGAGVPAAVGSQGTPAAPAAPPTVVVVPPAS